MFIGWLKFADVAEAVKIAESVGWLADGYHVKLMIMNNMTHCYGAYDNGKLIGAIMAIGYEKSAMIKYFAVLKEYQHQGIGRRLFDTLYTVLNAEYEYLYLHANPAMQTFFESYGFKTKFEVGRFVNVGKVPPFHFTNAHAKELDGANFDTVAHHIDKETFHEDRMEFLIDEMERNSSLKFATKNGFMHSSVVNARSVYLGPWQVREGHEDEAEKMMQGVLFFRGLKRIVADIPVEQKHVVSLYKKYNFEKKATFLHMVNKSRDIEFKNIYAFSL